MNDERPGRCPCENFDVCPDCDYKTDCNTPSNTMDVENYNKCRGVYSPLLEHNGIACGFWLCGQNYHNATPYFGAYPPSYLKRMGWLFPDHENFEVLHLFAGKTPAGTWKNETFIDVNPDLKVNDRWIIMDAEDLSMGGLMDGIVQLHYDLILADPPYDENHIKYGTDKINRKRCVKECAKVLRKGGHLVWIDTIIPIWAKADGWKLRGTIGMVQSTNHKCRAITILEKMT